MALRRFQTHARASQELQFLRAGLPLSAPQFTSLSTPMASSTGSRSSVKAASARIKHIHAKGFAFAQTERGTDIFIAPHVREALEISEVGQRVQLQFMRGEKGWVAIMPEKTSKVSWKEWQIGSSQVVIPDTKPGSPHTISFACWMCGTTLVEAAGIFKFKEGAIWTTTELSDVLARGNTFENKWKRVDGVPLRGFTALCRKCGHNVGSIYPQRYDEADPGPHSRAQNSTTAASGKRTTRSSTARCLSMSTHVMRRSTRSRGS